MEKFLQDLDAEPEEPTVHPPPSAQLLRLVRDCAECGESGPAVSKRFMRAYQCASWPKEFRQNGDVLKLMTLMKKNPDTLLPISGTPRAGWG